MKLKIIQRHHISYKPEVVTYLFRGEHWLITQLNRHKNVSKGLIECLKLFVGIHEEFANDLEPSYKMMKRLRKRGKKKG